MKKYIVLSDIKSSGKGAKLYAKKGQLVKEVADHGNVIIVEATTGERFPVTIEKLRKYN